MTSPEGVPPHDVTGRDVEDGEADGECPQAAVVGAAERGVLVEHGPVEMHADVGPRTRRTVAQNLRFQRATSATETQSYTIYPSMLTLLPLY